MTRTTVVIPESLKARAVQRARRTRTSFGQIVRRSLERFLEESPEDKLKNDPFWSDTYVYRGPVPKDLSANIDKYLYDEES